jgi:CheY-like chemotaxis protein
MAMMELDEASELFQDLEEIHKAGERAANLTRQLLIFSRKQTIVPRTVDINKVLADMDKMLSRLISEDIHLETSLDVHVGSIYADPGQLEQIIMNLVINARDAIQAQPEGGEKLIQISTSEVLLDQDHVVDHPASIPGWYVQLQVADSGCGMSEEVREHIFEPFYTTKGVGEGTGMGLATVYGIVKQNNGLIDVSSEPRQGTTFKIYWPRQVDEVAQVIEVEAEEVKGGSETILLVEDELQLRKVICLQLQKAGYTVIKAENGQLALELAINYSGMIDLLFTDVVMPLMGGNELSDKIKAIYPEIPIIFASGYTDKYIHQDIFKLGQASFINKPYNINDLLINIRRQLDSKKS